MPLAEIDKYDFLSDYVEALRHPDNRDVRKEYRQGTKPYIQTVEKAIEGLENAKALFEVGVREQFIIFSGKHAVGMAIVATNVGERPEGIESWRPGVSGYICWPYRKLKLGRFSLLERTKIVDEHFNGHAFTRVADDNMPSLRNITRAGFAPDTTGMPVKAGHGLYMYDKGQSGLILPSRFRD